MLGEEKMSYILTVTHTNKVGMSNKVATECTDASKRISMY